MDELGRELHAEGQSLNWLKWPINSDILNWWSLVRWQYDGQTVYGNDRTSCLPGTTAAIGGDCLPRTPGC